MARRPPPGFYARRAAAGGERNQPDQPRMDLERARQPGAAPQSHPVGAVISRIVVLLRADDLLQDVWVEGEVRNYSRSGAGHIYFRIADDDGALACVLFRGRNRGAKFEQGDEVLAHGQVEIYRARGDLQLIVDDVRPRGAGVLQAEFERLHALLEAEGLFAPNASARCRATRVVSAWRPPPRAPSGTMCSRCSDAAGRSPACCSAPA